MTNKAKIIIRSYQDTKIDIPEEIAGDVVKSKEYAIEEARKRTSSGLQHKVLEHWACKTVEKKIVQIQLSPPAETSELPLVEEELPPFTFTPEIISGLATMSEVVAPVPTNVVQIQLTPAIDVVEPQKSDA